MSVGFEGGGGNDVGLISKVDVKGTLREAGSILYQALR